MEKIYYLSKLGGETLHLQIVAADLLEGSNLTRVTMEDYGTLVLALEVCKQEDRKLQILTYLQVNLIFCGILFACEII